MLSVAKILENMEIGHKRDARAVGLDARSRDQLDELGVGLRVDRGLVEARPQLRAPQSTRTPGEGPRSGLLDPAHRSRPARGTRRTSRSPSTSCRWRGCSSGRSRSTTSSSTTSAPARSHGSRPRPSSEGSGARPAGRSRRTTSCSRCFPAPRSSRAARQCRLKRRPQPLGAHDHRLRALPGQGRRRSPRHNSRTRRAATGTSADLLGSCNLDDPRLLHLMSGQSLLPDRASPLPPTCRAIATPRSLRWFGRSASAMGSRTRVARCRASTQVVRRVLRLASSGGGGDTPAVAERREHSRRPKP